MSIQEAQSERYVQLTTDVSPAQANQILVESASTAFEGLPNAVPSFKTGEGSTRSFAAEYALIDGNIIIHFFLPVHAKAESFNKQPMEAREQWMAYWLKRFPVHLDRIARSYFEAEVPRLKAKYTEEVASWWFKADSYGHLLNVDKFVAGFFEQLDASLQRPDEST